MKTRFVVGVVLVLAAVAGLSPQSAAAAPLSSPPPPKACGPISGSVPSPQAPAAMAAVVDAFVGSDCLMHVTSVTFVPRSSIPAFPIQGMAAGPRGTVGAVGAAPANALGASQVSASATALGVQYAQHGEYQRAWDCCGILMTQLGTVATVQYQGSSVLGGSAYNDVAYHRELIGGWSLQYQNIWVSGRVWWQIGFAANAGFSYQGIFSPTGGHYYNSYYNAVQLRGNNQWSCQGSYNWAASFVGWHTQNWCF